MFTSSLEPSFGTNNSWLHFNEIRHILHENGMWKLMWPFGIVAGNFFFLKKIIEWKQQNSNIGNSERWNAHGIIDRHHLFTELFKLAQCGWSEADELYWLYCILLHVIYKWQIIYVIVSNNYLPPYFCCLKRTILPASNN